MAKKKKGKEKQRGIEPVGRKLHPEAGWAHKIIGLHPSIRTLVACPEALPDGSFRIRFSMSVSLPSQAVKKGRSETGVRATEAVILLFPSAYPYEAPMVLLRPDFNTSLPHINPIMIIDSLRYVSPCIYDGSLNDLLHQEYDGLSKILDRLSDWLNKAAINDLIDPDQGWEVMRRDHTSGWIAYDVSRLETFVTDQEGYCAFRCRFSIEKWNCGAWVDDGKAAPLSPASALDMLSCDDTPLGPLYRGLTLLVWGNSQSIAGRYLPEDVENLRQLNKRATDYGVSDALSGALVNLGVVMKGAGLKFTKFPVFVIFCIRRPYHLTGSHSELEFIPYLIHCKLPDWAGPLPASIIMISEDSGVMPLGHHHKVSKKLLRTMSGLAEPPNGGSIIHVGCGSVGSKIAMHLARAGQDPFVLIDKASFSPHNVARHALVPFAEFPGIPKALVLAEEIGKLRLKAVPMCADVTEILKAQTHAADPFHENNGLIIESTGSIAVRDMFAAISPGRMAGRLFHAVLYSEGKIGIIAIEGRHRNPNVNDLVARFYDECVEDPELRDLFSAGRSVERQEVGLGCGSQTMVMPDTRVSLFASGMAQRALQLLEDRNEWGNEGELWIGKLAQDQMSVSWKGHRVGRTIKLQFDGRNRWEVRVSERVVKQMKEEMETWGDTETGGVLIGKISMYDRCFNVTRLIEAPSDSERTKSSFILGIEGLRERVREVHDRSEGALTYLGTWHTHPKGGEASPTDRLSLDRLTTLRFGTPAIGLIVMPFDISVILNEGRFG